MNINVATKFNIGEKVFRKFLDGYLSLEILGIEIHVNKNNELEIYYTFKPYSDSNFIDTISENQLFLEYEIN